MDSFPDPVVRVAPVVPKEDLEDDLVTTLQTSLRSKDQHMLVKRDLTIE